MADEVRLYQEHDPFPGVIGRTISESTPAWVTRPRAADAAPNVVIVLLDDVGFGEFGCFGSGIQTPTIDRLAADGLRYRDFHTAAICTPSRACLLTGRNPHANGFAPPTGSGFPGYNGMIPRANGFLSEVLRTQGYATFALGKWHLAPDSECNAGSSRAGWPLSRGFDRFYGFWGGTDQFTPELVYDNHLIEPPKTPEQGYHLSSDLADRAIEFVADLRAVAPHKPFFMYFCPAAGHAPHQVPGEWADGYRDRFDHGWDRYREEIFSRQLEMDVIPPSTKLTGRPQEIPAWDGLDADERRVLSRQMEVYAGFVSHADHQIGRIVNFLDELGELDNTLLLVTSDNGASREGGRYGGNVAQQQGMNAAEIMAMNLRLLEEWGGPRTQCHYASGWAWAGNTPLRRWKGYLNEGGLADPLVVHWPAGIDAKGEIRHPYAYITDIAPTVMESLGIEPPAEIDGVRQSAIHGVSFAHTFDDAGAATKKSVQYFEMLGSRAIWKGGWKAVAEQTRHAVLTGEDLDRQRWELYHVAEDFSEYTDLAAEHPEKLRELIDLWWVEAGKHGVLPLDARANARWTTKLYYGRAERGEAPRTRFVYFPHTAKVPDRYAPDVNGRPHRITAEVTLTDDDAGGVLLIQGDGHYGGYSLHVMDRRLHYVHNWMGFAEYRISSNGPLPTGSVSLGFQLESTVDGRGTGVISVDGEEVGRGTIPRFTPNTGDISAPNAPRQGLSCGYAFGRAPTGDYRPPFRFTGIIHRVVVDVGDVTND